MTSEELDAAAGLNPRNCNPPRFDPGVRCLVHLAAFAGTLAVAAMILAVINFPMRKDGSGRVFSPNDCARVVEDRVPSAEAPPGTDLRLPDIR